LIEGVAQDEANKVADELDKNRLDGVKMLIAGYEGNELMFARLMHEAGAKILYVSTSVRNAPGTKIDQEWLEERGIEVLFRKRHEDDLEAIKEHKPDIVFGSSNLEAVAKRLGIPSVYYTNIVSARPILLSAGVRPLVEQVKLILSQQKIYASMRDFFADTN
jgi:chlorophyllide a reductase subunit Y